MIWATAARNRHLAPMFAGATWRAWRRMARAWDGRADLLTDEGRDFVRSRMGYVPSEAPLEVYIAAGRQAGKSHFVGGVVVPALALFPGVAPPCQIILAARTLDQTRQLFAYARASLRAMPGLVVEESAKRLVTRDGVTVERVTSDWRTVRGRVIAGAVLDELAHWRTDRDAVNPDVEFLRAIRPALRARSGGGRPGLLVGMSSPWQQDGVLWGAWRMRHGREAPPDVGGDDEHARLFGGAESIQVMQAATWDMRPDISTRDIERSEKTDPVNHAVEWGGQFRADSYGFLRLSEIEACVERGVVERAPVAGRAYSMFVDHSGGAGRDAAAGAVGHVEGGRWVVDAVRVIDPPFVRVAMVAELAALAKRYRVHRVTGDQWDGVMHAHAWREHGYRYEPAPRNKSMLYLDAMPRIVEGSVVLPDVERLHDELAGLERRTMRNGREAVDHAPNRRDDLANAVCGLIAGEVRRAPVLVVG